MWSNGTQRQPNWLGDANYHPTHSFIDQQKQQQKKRYFQRYEKRKIQEKHLIVPLNLNNILYFNSKNEVRNFILQCPIPQY